jgi:hypothetical protein
MEGDVSTSQWRAEKQELNHLAEHDDAAWLSIIASAAVFKSVSAFECEASVLVSCQLDVFEEDSTVEKLHLIQIALAAGPLHGDLVDSGTFEPQPEKTSQNGYADDFKPRHDGKRCACCPNGWKVASGAYWTTVDRTPCSPLERGGSMTRWVAHFVALGLPKTALIVKCVSALRDSLSNNSRL